MMNLKVDLIMITSNDDEIHVLRRRYILLNISVSSRSLAA